MNKIFGMAEQALMLTEERANLITGNLVNSATPNYKAKDIDFDRAIQDATNKTHALNTTHANHLHPSSALASGANIKYRIPMQTSMDNNTVDPEIERKNFLENAIKYQVSLTFVQNKTDSLMKAIKGE